MTNEEKRQQAVAAELKALDDTVESFQSVVDNARALTASLNAAGQRMERMEREFDIDRKIDELDYAMKRGQYAYLRTDPTIDAARATHRIYDEAERLARVVDNANVVPMFFKQQAD